MDTFKLIIELIEALAKFAWPAVVLISVLIFRKSISSSILRRIKKGKAKFGDKELEFELEAEQFHESVLKSGQKMPELPVTRPSSDNEQAAIEPPPINTDVDEILKAAKTNPKVAIMRLAVLLERELKALVALLGLPGPQKHVSESAVDMSPIRLCEILVGHYFLPNTTTNSLKKFWQLYNRIIHGREQIHEDTLLGVLDSYF